MKFTAKVRFVVDDDFFNIRFNQTTDIDVDMDCANPDEAAVIREVEVRLYRKYRALLIFSRIPGDDGDFVIDNLPDLIESLNEGASAK